MPVGRPDRPVALIVLVAPTVAALALLVIYLVRGDVAAAARLGLVVLLLAPVLVYVYRRDFRDDD